MKSDQTIIRKNPMEQLNLGTIYLFTLTTIWSASENIQKGDFRNGNRLLM